MAAGKKVDSSELEKLREAFNTVAAIPEGTILFRYLLSECGFFRPSVLVDPKTMNINIDGTVYNEARRNLYLDVRKYLTIKNLRKIELSK